MDATVTHATADWSFLAAGQVRDRLHFHVEEADDATPGCRLVHAAHAYRKPNGEWEVVNPVGQFETFGFDDDAEDAAKDAAVEYQAREVTLLEEFAQRWGDEFTR